MSRDKVIWILQKTLKHFWLNCLLGVPGYNNAGVGYPSQDGYPDPTAQDIYVSSSLRYFIELFQMNILKLDNTTSLF